MVLRSCLELSDFFAAILPTRSPKSAEPEWDTSRIHANKGGASKRYFVVKLCSFSIDIKVRCFPHVHFYLL